MRHAWVFEVLQDLFRYAQVNGLPSLAAKVEDALIAARAEIGPDDRGPESSGMPQMGD
jgi:hypothetical protein